MYLNTESDVSAQTKHRRYRYRDRSYFEMLDQIFYDWYFTIYWCVLCHDSVRRKWFVSHRCLGIGRYSDSWYLKWDLKNGLSRITESLLEMKQFVSQGWWCSMSRYWKLGCTADKNVFRLCFVSMVMSSVATQCLDLKSGERFADRFTTMSNSSAVRESRENTECEELRDLRWELLPYGSYCVIVERVRRELPLCRTAFLYNRKRWCGWRRKSP